MIFRFFLEVSYGLPPCGSSPDAQPPDWWIKLIYKFHYLHFGLLLWGITSIITIIISIIVIIVNITMMIMIVIITIIIMTNIMIAMIMIMLIVLIGKKRAP